MEAIFYKEESLRTISKNDKKINININIDIDIFDMHYICNNSL